MAMGNLLHSPHVAAIDGQHGQSLIATLGLCLRESPLTAMFQPQTALVCLGIEPHKVACTLACILRYLPGTSDMYIFKWILNLSHRNPYCRQRMRTNSLACFPCAQVSLWLHAQGDSFIFGSSAGMSNSMQARMFA